MKQNYHIFCDFDGTISMEDMISKIMMKFVRAPATPIIEQIQAQVISIQQGVESLFQLIPTEWYTDIVEFAQSTTQIRPGFYEFAQYAKSMDWPISIVSGGFDFFVAPAIAPVRTCTTLYCNHIDTSESHLRVVWDHPCDTTCAGGCGLCKPTIIRQHSTNGSNTLVIGDGVTDLKAARMAKLIFARSHLCTLLQGEQILFYPFESFFDILDKLQTDSMLQGGTL